MGDGTEGIPGGCRGLRPDRHHERDGRPFECESDLKMIVCKGVMRVSVLCVCCLCV